MKITLDMIYKEKACNKHALVLYHKLNLQNIDLDRKEITIYEFDNSNYLRWLTCKFKLTMNIVYIEFNKKVKYIYMYKNGKCISFTVFRINTNNDYCPYNNTNELLYEEIMGYKEIFIDGLLTSIESYYKFTECELRYDIKELN